jgi:predicted small secreted protein
VIKIIVVILACLSIAGCATIEDIRSSDAAKAVGSFQLNTVHPNNYWYNGTTYEYNAYEIKIISKPIQAKIKWNDNYIGNTPLVYKFSGTLDKGERINVIAIPMDENLQAQEATLKVQDELPKEIHFDFKT